MIHRSQHLGTQPVGTVDGALAAANDLSDLASTATARTNLGGGADKIIIDLGAINVVGATATVRRFVAPVAGDIAAIRSVLNDSLTTGDATLTAAIGGTPVTGGVVTITQDGSAAGDVDSAVPTAANTVAVGDVITITAGGTNDAAVTASVIVEITPSA
jgi:hypothetical protein